jgi:signal transduction histidine kinase
MDRPERVAVNNDVAPVQAARTMGLSKDSLASAGLEAPATVAAVPIGGHEGSVGVLELVKRGALSADDEWFLREFALIAGLGIGNARLIEERSQLRRFDKAKSRFVSLLMHQIGSPLATVACSLQAIRQLGEKLTASDREELTGCAIERIESIQALSRKLLDLAAIRGGKSLRDIRAVCPAVPLRQEIEDRLPLARGRGVDLVLDDQSQGAEVMADPDGLRIIFGNLLDNAIKYSTGPVKRVEAELAKEEGGVRVRVKDSGIGIPAQEQPRVFEELYRGSNAAGAGASGFGLGLAVVKELVDRYNGRIELESAVGVGTTFTLRFPALARAECLGSQ